MSFLMFQDSQAGKLENTREGLHMQSTVDGRTGIEGPPPARKVRGYVATSHPSYLQTTSFLRAEGNRNPTCQRGRWPDAVASRSTGARQAVTGWLSPNHCVGTLLEPQSKPG